MVLDHLWDDVYGELWTGALAMAILATRFLETEKPLARVVSPDRWHDLGNLLLALVMLWATEFSQFC